MRDRASPPQPVSADAPAPGSHHRGVHPWKIEGGRPSDDEASGSPVQRPPHRRPSIWLLFALLLAVNWIFALNFQTAPTRVTVPYSYFDGQAQAGNVAQVSSQGATIQGAFRHAVRYPAGKSGKSTTEFKTERPAFADDHLLNLLESKSTVVTAKPLKGQSLLVTLLIGFVPTLLLVGFFIWMMRRAAGAGGAGGMLGGMGRSKARKYEANEQRTTFRRRGRYR